MLTLWLTRHTASCWLPPDKTGAVGYGKGTEAGDIEADNAGKIIKVTYHPEASGTGVTPAYEAGDITVEWDDVT